MKQQSLKQVLLDLFLAGIVLTGTVQLPAQDIQFEGEAENLGSGVNTSYSEVAPIISPDGKTLYFNRKNHPGNSGGTDDKDEIWYSSLQEDGVWSPAVNIGSPLNNADNNALQSISPDGHTICLLNAYNYFDGSMSPGVSLAYSSRGGWNFPVKQNVKNLDNKSDYAAYFLSANGNVLLLSVDTKKSRGERDIYVSFRTGEKDWSKPLNLGDDINTKMDDGAPFLAADNKTLFFSTAGHGGYGNEDILMSKRLDDTWTHWSEPVNMGSKVNTPDWDSYFSIPASGDYAYFVSYKNGFGQADIFRIKLPGKAKPDPVALIAGQVIDAKTSQPVQAIITYELLPSGTNAGVARSGVLDGQYKIVLPYGFQYGFHAEAKGYYAIDQNIDLRTLKEYKELNRNLALKPVEVGSVFRLNNIFFNFGKATLEPSSYPELDRLADFLTTNGTLNIEIAGHTDNVGADEDNQKLSADRAQAVVDYLIGKGIKNSRLKAVGYGETVPVASNDTDEGRALNRRVEFKILTE